MEMLFAALRAKHPGYEVVDVRFLASSVSSAGKDADEVDHELASAVVSARDVDLTKLR